MTHRSRNGGPPKSRTSGNPRPRTKLKGQAPRKLHHPPQPPAPEPDSPRSGPIVAPTSLLSDPTDAAVLQLIHHALRSTVDSPSLVATVQEIKAKLYDQKWLEVFTDPRLLEAYAARWVPSRAVCYRDLMVALPELREMLLGVEGVADSEGSEGRNDGDGSESGDSDDSEDSEEDHDKHEDEVARGGDKAVTKLAQRTSELKVSDGAGTGMDANAEDSHVTTSAEASSSSAPTGHVLSLGGGAGSELLALASVLKAAPPSLKGKERAWSWTGLDIGSWGAVLDEFSNTLRAEWQLELPAKYIQGDMLGSRSPTSSNGPVSEDRPEEEPSHRPVDIASILTATPPKLITLLFTLTELFSQSRPATLRFLHLLTAHVPPGTLFLVADSASDISEFAIGSAGRKWPVWMILDMALTSGEEGKGAEWDKVRGEDSRWYRLPEGVGAGWPVKLENTRYWYRLYRRA